MADEVAHLVSSGAALVVRQEPNNREDFEIEVPVG
jgi:hypothetical protein